MHVYELNSSLNVGINVIRHFLMFMPILLHFESYLPNNIETFQEKAKWPVVAILSSVLLMTLFSYIKDMPCTRPPVEKKSVNCFITYPPYIVLTKKNPNQTNQNGQVSLGLFMASCPSHYK